MRLTEDHYEGRTFLGEDLSGAKIEGLSLVDCRFEGCDLRGASLGAGVLLRGVSLVDCRLTGTLWSAAAPLCQELAFEDCDLSLASFIAAHLGGARFTRVRGEDLRFEGCDLSASRFEHSALPGARFEACDLRGADLTGLEGARLDPARNRLGETRLSLDLARTLLEDQGARVPELGHP